MNMRHLLCGFLLLALFATGCEKNTGSDMKLPLSDTKNGADNEIETSEDEGRESLEGNWILFVLGPGEGGKPVESPLMLLEVHPEAKTDPVKAIGSLPSWQFRSGKVEGDKITFTATMGEDNWTYEGTFDRGGVLGNFASGKRPFLARLLATNREDFEVAAAKPIPADGEKALQQAMNSADRYAGLVTFAKNNPFSPLLMVSYEQRLQLVKRQRLKKNEIKELIAAYLKEAERWGSRQVEMSHYTVAQLFTHLGIHFDLAEEHLSQLEKLVGDDKDWKQTIAGSRDAIQVIQAKDDLIAGTKEEQKAAYEKLNELKKEGKTGVPIDYLLADYAADNDDEDRAIELLSQLVAQPGAEAGLAQYWSNEGLSHQLPSAKLKKLWKKKHGNEDGIAEHIDQVYQTHTVSLESDDATQYDTSGNRVTLLELFTGSECPPCVAGDLATGALQNRFDHSSVVVLRYHQHIPRPDPLANSTSEARYFAYGISQGTPTLMINGQNTMSVGGYYQNAKASYQRLLETVPPLFSETTDLQIQLDVKPSGDNTFTLGANVEGIGDAGETYRLVLVVAENNLSFRAGNGIRHHEMIVRSMPAGEKGVPAKAGKLEFQSTFSIEELRNTLKSYLSEFEKGKGVSFVDKPLDLQGLTLVAFVQDSETNEVLQVATAPITESKTEPTPTTETPEVTQPTTPTEAKPASNTTPVEAPKPAAETESETSLIEESQLSMVALLDEEEGKEEESKEIKRDSVEGRWMLYINRNTVLIPVALVDVEKKDGKLTAKMAEKPRTVPPLVLRSSQFKKDTEATLNFALQGTTPLVFKGVLHANHLLGTVQIGRGSAEPGIMQPTEVKKLTNQMQSPGPVPLANEVRKAATSDDPIAALRKFSADNPANPYSLSVYGDIFSLVKDEKLKNSEIEEIANEYLDRAKVWGPNMALQSQLTLAELLISSGASIELARKQLTTLEKSLAADEKADFAPLIQEIRNAADLAETKIWLLEGTEEQQKKALATLEKLNDGMNAEVMYLLASYQESKGKTEAALEQYASIVVLPGLERTLARQWASQGVRQPLPSQKLPSLWKKAHGNSEGLNAYLTKLYKEAVHKLAGDKVTPRPLDASNKVAVIELFTGTMCPPCVSADLAFGSLVHNYATTDLVTLQYHMHIPGPDPMTNPASESRFRYYQGRGTPTVAIDGNIFPGSGGFLEHAKGVETRMREVINASLKDKTDVRFDLAADAADGKLDVSAKVSGIEKPGEDLRLRLVLVEKEVDFPGRNGIRVHEMVVRAMPGGAEGIAPKDGALSYKETVELADVKQGLVDYLDEYETRRRMQFAGRPLDLQNLYLVAFVQNDGSKEILHSSIIPVKGKLDFTPKKKADDKEDEKKDDES